ncbi:PR domain zinc finger protein 14-like isoform X1 [Mytilus galloprovincialis]|uniref:PR domain zinc finger protein 14-like isoform X1 n=1 Tax=Mytilus galloprovincialis TaxID=29158 RepID=UPI003F7C5789
MTDFQGLFVQPTMMSSEYLQQYYPMMQQYRNFAEISNRLYPGHQIQRSSTYFFTQEDLDFVLFGYSSNGTPAHALSGLKIGEISHGAFFKKNGIDRLLSHSPARSLPVSSWKLSRSEPPPHDLPEELCICPNTFAGIVHYGVFSRHHLIKKETKYGPFKGKVVNTSEIKSFDDNSYMWEIFQNGQLSHFVDGRGSTGSWMSYVNCARHVAEQNIVVIQEGDSIFYETSRDIPVGTELLVWYGDSYSQFMGIPLTLKDGNEDLPKTPIEHESKEGFTCERCGKVFAYQYYRDKHLKYTKCVDQGDRKYPCTLCTRSFEKRDRLRIHILHVHEKHRPHKCSVCAKSFSQSSSLNKHMRVHSGERPYKCVYCSKSFTASSILRTHIRQHSGERPFKCKYCGKAFASHAAHDSHVRRTHTRDKSSKCGICGLEFKNEVEQRLHSKTHETPFNGWKTQEIQKNMIGLV